TDNVMSRHFIAARLIRVIFGETQGLSEPGGHQHQQLTLRRQLQKRAPSVVFVDNNRVLLRRGAGAKSHRQLNRHAKGRAKSWTTQLIEDQRQRATRSLPLK